MKLDKKKLWLVLWVLPCFLFMAPEDPGHSSHSMDFLGKVINFVVLFGGLFLILKNPVKNYFIKRRKKVDLSLKEAAEARKESEERLSDVRARLNSLSEEVKEIHEQAKEEGKKQKEEIMRSAQKETQRMRELSQQEIDSIFTAGIKQLRAYAADLTTEMAAERIKQKMCPKLQAAIIDKSIERLDKLYEKSNSG